MAKTNPEKPPRSKRQPEPDELVVWRSPHDGKYYCSRFAATGDVRSVSEGYDDEDDAIANAAAQERGAVRRTDVTDLGRPDWLTPREPRRRERGRWLRKNRTARPAPR